MLNISRNKINVGAGDTDPLIILMNAYQRYTRCIYR